MTFIPGKLVLSNPLTCTNTAKGDNKLYSDARGVVPSLDLRFASQKNLNDYMTGTPLVDHQRNMSNTSIFSPGTFVNSSGLVETAKVNLISYSQDLSQGVWAKGATTTVDADSTLAPDGTFTADALGTTSTGFLAYRAYNITGTYTASAYIKDNGAGSCAFAMGRNTGGYLINFNTTTGAYISGRSYGGGTLVSYSINPVSNGWFRVIVTATATAGGVLIQQADGTSPTSGVYVWGAQLEEDTTASTYIPTTNVPSAAPRFDHDPTTGESLGLLIEEQRTNILLNSATLSTQSVTTSGTAYTLSFYGTGTVTLSGTSTAGPLVGTGADDRVTLTFTPTAGTLTLTVTGTVSNAQLEEGSFPTSYIPTTGTALTRSADEASISGTNFSSWYNQSEGTIFHDGRYIGDVPGNLYGLGNGLIFYFRNTALDLFLYQWSLGIYRGAGISNPPNHSSALYNGTTGVFLNVADQLANNPVGSRMKSVGFINTSTGEFGHVLNGGTIRSNSANNIPIWNKVSLSAGYNNQARCGTIARFTYFPERLPDATLQAITAT